MYRLIVHHEFALHIVTSLTALLTCNSPLLNNDTRAFDFYPYTLDEASVMPPSSTQRDGTRKKHTEPQLNRKHALRSREILSLSRSARKDFVTLTRPTLTQEK